MPDSTITPNYVTNVQSNDLQVIFDTSDKGLIYIPDVSCSLECYINADFAGGWASGDNANPESVLSRTGFDIMYAGCPIYWCRKLQTAIALSTRKTEYIVMSQAMCKICPFLYLMNEIQSIFPLKNFKPIFYWNSLKTIAAALKLLKVQS